MGSCEPMTSVPQIEWLRPDGSRLKLRVIERESCDCCWHKRFLWGLFGWGRKDHRAYVHLCGRMIWL
jgi:hypothetical protein